MKVDDEEFFKKLLSTFKLEAEDRLQKISLSLLELEKTQDENQSLTLVELIYRELHSLKSAARAVNMLSVEKICQKLESLFSSWKKAKKKPNEQQFDLLYKLNTKIERLIDDSKNDNPIFLSETEELLNKLDLLDAAEVANITNKESIGMYTNVGKTTSTQFDETVDKTTSSEPERIIGLEEKTIRIPAVKLDTLLVQAEEMLATKLNFLRNYDELNDLRNDMVSLRKLHSKIFDEKFLMKNFDLSLNRMQNTDKNTLDRLRDCFVECESLSKSMLIKLDALCNNFEQNIRNFGLRIDDLLEESKKMMLLPFSTILNALPITVRDLSSTLGKKVNFQLLGAELEIDKRILVEMKDVFIHIIRNSIDHGIENLEVRRSLKKPDIAELSIDIKHMTGNEIQLEIKDDGAGIDLEKIKQSAIKQKIISNEEAQNMSPHEALMLIFQSGVSTQENVSDLSGRGLGMSIIREKIEKIGGKIAINSQENSGTIIRITLPLTLATFKGLLVQVSKQEFVVPTSNLEKIISFDISAIKKIENKETILYGNQVIALVWLADVLGITRKPKTGDKFLAFVLSSDENAMAFVVDEILNESEILVKQFSYPIVKIKNISAAAILGSGRPTPILNTIDLLENNPSSSLKMETNLEGAEILEKNKRILLAEDSITTRMLIKNILELGGFQVTTAVDGLEAWEILREKDFELVVSDIEMPRMDGFELTKRIRKDKKLTDLPIVLVTSLANQEDREKGIDLGANAYIVKSSFDSKHLLDIINKLSL